MLKYIFLKIYNLLFCIMYQMINYDVCTFYLQIFAQANEKFNVQAALEETNENGVPQLECITPLRLLLESEKNPERWKNEVKDMEAHNKIRSQKKQWKSDQINIVEYIRKQLKLER